MLQDATKTGHRMMNGAVRTGNYQDAMTIDALLLTHDQKLKHELRKNGRKRVIARASRSKFSPENVNTDDDVLLDNLVNSPCGAEIQSRREVAHGTAYAARRHTTDRPPQWFNRAQRRRFWRWFRAQHVVTQIVIWLVSALLLWYVSVNVASLFYANVILQWQYGGARIYSTNITFPGDKLSSHVLTWDDHGHARVLIELAGDTTQKTTIVDGPQIYGVSGPIVFTVQEKDINGDGIEDLVLVGYSGALSASFQPITHNIFLYGDGHGRYSLIPTAKQK